MRFLFAVVVHTGCQEEVANSPDIRFAPDTATSVATLTADTGGTLDTPDSSGDTANVGETTGTVSTGETGQETASHTGTGAPVDTSLPVLIGPRFPALSVAEDIAIARITFDAGDFGDPDMTSRIGDLNGDGIADLVVDSDLSTPNDNGTYIFFGPVVGTFHREEADLFLQWISNYPATESAGDVNGDGSSDLWIGDSAATLLVHGPFEPGEAEVESVASARWYQPDQTQGGQMHPSGVDSGRDVNGDGVLDVLLGDPSGNAPDLVGAAWLLYGPLPDGDFRPVDIADSSWDGNEEEHWALGLAVLLDLDGDGLADPAMGCYGHDVPLAYASGALHLSLSPIPAGLQAGDSFDGNWLAETTCTEFTESLARGGDLDGDGREDLLLGCIDKYPEGDSPWNTYGAVYVVLGPGTGDHYADEAWWRVYGVEDASPQGWGLTEAGDMDLDGHDDLFIGARAADTSGGVYLYYGPIKAGLYDPTAADSVIFSDGGGELGGGFGQGLTVPGDVTGDGFPDLLVSAPLYNQPGQNAGSVFLFDPTDF